MKQHRSELLTLLNSRKSWEGKLPYLLPQYGAESQRTSRMAVQCVGHLEGSDPFAGPRTALYLRRGYCVPSEVLKDCRSRQSLRDREPRGGVRDEVALLQVKRGAEQRQKKLDADKAWNQFNHSRYIEEKAA